MQLRVVIILALLSICGLHAMDSPEAPIDDQKNVAKVSGEGSPAPSAAQVSPISTVGSGNAVDVARERGLAEEVDPCCQGCRTYCGMWCGGWKQGCEIAQRHANSETGTGCCAEYVAPCVAGCMACCPECCCRECGAVCYDCTRDVVVSPLPLCARRHCESQSLRDEPCSKYKADLCCRRAWCCATALSCGALPLAACILSIPGVMIYECAQQCCSCRDGRCICGCCD